MPSSTKPSSRKSPPELLIKACTTTSPFVATHCSTVSTLTAPIDLTTENGSGADSLSVSGETLTCIWDDDYIEFCIVEGEKGGNVNGAASCLGTGTQPGRCGTC